MNIINLTQTQFKNYSNIHSKRNFGQTIEYTMQKDIIGKEKIFLGLTDNQSNIHAAVLLIITNISPLVKEAYAPDGFLIDYSNFELVKEFTIKLREHLKKLKITYLITDPMFKYKVYNNNNQLIENNENTLNNLIKLDFKTVGYRSDFERYDIIIENNESNENIYKNFNRNTKRNIKDSITMGITLSKGKPSDLETFYNIIKKKKKNSLSFYSDLLNSYNTKDNKMELFFIKLNPHKFLTNSKKVFDKATERSEQVSKNMQRKIGHITEKLLNKKIKSDSVLEKCKQRLNTATKMFQKEQEEIIIGTCAIIKNNKEIYFLIDGYKEEYRQIHSSHLLKWAIIKKYHSLGYNIFNLGEIHKDYQNKENKYYGQYMYKIGFGGNIVEYPPNLLLVINKYAYNTYKNLNKILIKKK